MKVSKECSKKKPTFEVSKNYPDFYEGLDLNNTELMQTFRYKDIIEKYVSSLVTGAENYSDNSDFFVLFQKELANSNLKPEIKDRLGLENSEYGFTYAKDKDLYYKTYMSFVVNEDYKNRFQKRYNKIKMEKGNPSPNFSFTDSNEKKYSLDTFKGQYIYIDIWASWCSPCIAQIPHLKRLEKKYKGKVSFVSIAWNDNKENWKSALTKFKLKGNQLYAPDKKGDFFQFYNVTSIPRFILLDREGNIIESNAKQPSDKSLDEQLNALK